LRSSSHLQPGWQAAFKLRLVYRRFFAHAFPIFREIAIKIVFSK
jgi:hypothetical protein